MYLELPSLFSFSLSNVLDDIIVQTEMKLFGAPDAETLKQHFGRKIMELEDEKRAVQVQ